MTEHLSDAEALRTRELSKESDETDALLRFVGLALHNWSRVEGSLIDLLWRCMETKTPQPASIVWSNIISIDPKLKIIDQMLPLIISDKQALTLWKEIEKSVRNRNRKRASLAHYEIVKFDKGLRLVPKYQSADLGKLAHADTAPENAIDRLMENFETRGYRAADIEQIAENFATLKTEIRWYIDWVIEFKRIPTELDSNELPPLIERFLYK